MKKQLLATMAMVLLWGVATSQVGINTTNPADGSILDIDSDDKGILIPRVDINNLNNIAPITGGSPEGLLVYNTNTTIGTGYFYWNGSSWVAVGSERGWSLTGNAGTDAANNFIGTTDNQPLAFRVNDTERMGILTNGNVGMGGYYTDVKLAVIGGTNYNGVYSVINHSSGISVEAQNQNTSGVGLIGYTGTTSVTLAGTGATFKGQSTGGASFGNTTGFSGVGNGGLTSYSLTNGVGVAGTGFVGIYGYTTNTGLGWGGYFNGDVRAIGVYANAIYITSDERIKSNFRNVDSALDKILQLNPQLYDKNVTPNPNQFVSETATTFQAEKLEHSTESISEASTVTSKGKESNQNKESSQSNQIDLDDKIITEYGFIAQELEDIFPLLVKEKRMNLKYHDEIDLKSVNYTGLIPILTKAIQEQQEIIDSQEARIAKLESLVQELINKN